MNKLMGKQSGKYFIGGWVLLVLAVWMQFLFFKPNAHFFQKRNIQKHAISQQDLMQKAAQYIAEVVVEHNINWLWKNEAIAHDYLNKNNIHLFVTRNDSLLFWTSNLVSGANLLNDRPVKRKLLRFNNAWCLKHVLHKNEYTVYSIYPVKFEYRITNDIIQDHFPDLEIPSKTAIFPFFDQENVNIQDKSDFLFGLKFSGGDKGSVIFRNLSILLFNLALVCFIIWFYIHISIEINKKKRLIWILALIVVLSAILIGLQTYKMPSVFYELELFSPRIFAIPTFFHSLGVLLYFSVFWLAVGFAVYRHNPFSVSTFSKTKQFIGTLFLLGVFILLAYLFLVVIDNSVINFEIYQLAEADLYSFLVYGVFMVFFGGWALWLARLLQSMVKNNPKAVWKNLNIITAFICTATILLQQYELVYATLSGYCIILFTYYLYHKKKGDVNFLHSFLYTFIFANMLVMFVWTRANTIETEKQKTAIVNVSEGWFSERDRFAEIILLRMAPQMKRDAKLKRLVCAQNPDPMEVKKYLDEEYFTGQWKKYDIEVVICWPDADLVIESTGERTACYPYFYSMVEESCEKIGETDFYFQNDKNGRISYLGWFIFNEYQPMEASLFLDIQSNPLSKGVGYPELLIDDLTSGHVLTTTRYDFARYYNNHLVTYTGEFRYNTLADWVPPFEGEFSRFQNNGYTHLVYRYGEDDLVVLSNVKRQWYDYVLF